LREVTPIETYRFDRGEGSRAFTETQLVNEAHVVGVTEPFWTAATAQQFSHLLRQ